MELRWFHISMLLCFFGFLKEFRPSESYTTDFTAFPYRNITREQLNKEIFPFGIYATAVELIIVLLLTDFVRYKPVIIVIGASGAVTKALLIWTSSYTAAYFIEIAYATYIASEIAYFTYIYAKVDKEHYLTVSSHTRAALLAGKCLSGVLGQALLTTKTMGLRELHKISFSTQIAATIWAFLLPPVKNSLYFNRESEVSLSFHSTPSTPRTLENGVNADLKTRITKAFQIIWMQLKTAFANRQVKLWSFWYVCGTCADLQIFLYSQMLWASVDNRPEVVWNGAVEASTTLLASFAALLAGRVHNDWLAKSKMLWLLVVLSFLQAGSVCVSSNTTNRFVSYAGYGVFYLFYTFTITISSSEIAKNLPEDSYGLIFGINTFAAIVLQAVLSLVVVTDAFGLNYNIFEQFHVYAMCLVVLGMAYLVPIAGGFIWCKENVSLEKKAVGLSYKPNLDD